MSCTRYHPLLLLLLLLLSGSYGALLRSRPVLHLVRDTDLSGAGNQPEAGGSGDLSEAAAPGPCSMLLVHAGKAARAEETIRAGILKRQGKKHLQHKQLAESLPPESAREQLACECTHPVASQKHRLLWHPRNPLPFALCYGTQAPCLGCWMLSTSSQLLQMRRQMRLLTLQMAPLGTLQHSRGQLSGSSCLSSTCPPGTQRYRRGWRAAWTGGVPKRTRQGLRWQVCCVGLRILAWLL